MRRIFMGVVFAIGVCSSASADWVGSAGLQLGSELPQANGATTYYWLSNFFNRPGISAAGTASVIRCGSDVPPGTGDSWTYVLEKSTDQGTTFSPTTLTCTQTDTNLSCGASSGSATVAGGDMLRIAGTCNTVGACATGGFPSCGITLE